MKRRALLLALAVAAAGAALPGQAAAQGCTTKCGCYSDGCGCQSSGGNGSGCDASGNGCFVKKCGTAVAFSPDGEALPANARVVADAAPEEWEKVAPGVEVLRSCTGLVLARRYAAGAADAIRSRDEVIEI